MIVALLSDPFLRATVRKAALPDEDVVWKAGAVREALDRGFPRLAVHASDDRATGGPERLVPDELPLLGLTGSTLDAWENSRRSGGFAISRVDDHARRLRSLMNSISGPLPWVEGIFRDLRRATGHRLPRPVRGLGRRVLEFPSRYEDLHALAGLTGLSRGALKARFRRRDLPSPYAYLRWFRVLAAAHVLADPDVTTEEAAYRTGLHSSGNLCRYVQDVSGLAPTDLRRNSSRTLLVTRFARQCFEPVHREGWTTLDDLFLTEAA